MKKPGNQKAPTSPDPSPGRLVVDACCELLRTLQRADVLQEDTGHAMRLQRLLSKAFVKYLFGRVSMEGFSGLWLDRPSYSNLVHACSVTSRCCFGSTWKGFLELSGKGMSCVVKSSTAFRESSRLRGFKVSYSDSGSRSSLEGCRRLRVLCGF